MVMGRPRTVSLPPDQMIELGKEMIKWVKEHDPLHLSAFYSIEKEYLESEWVTMIKRPEFVGYYERAMRIIGQKYLDKTSNVRDGVSQRWQRVYFKDLRDEEDEKTRHDAQVKAQAMVKEAQAMNLCDLQTAIVNNHIKQKD